MTTRPIFAPLPISSGVSRDSVENPSQAVVLNRDGSSIVNPVFMMIGIQKGGTSWLSERLNEVRLLQRSNPKEIRFFSDHGWKKSFDSMPDDAVRQCYHAHWKPEGKPIWFEASPGYLARQAAAERIARYFPATKFLVLLRDPVLRAFSAYNMWVRNRGFSQSFREAFEPVVKHITSVRKSVDDETAFYDSVSDNRERRLFTHGLYYHHLKIWFSFFPRDRFFILTTKQLNDREKLAELLGFIGIDPQLTTDMRLDEVPPNRHTGDPIARADADRLNAFYDEYNNKLFDLLGVESLDW